jgi:tRNA pseudouridine55 synthase
MTERVSVPSRVVLVDKPVGWTSFDVVKRARRGIRAKVGHAGTLDPFATGLLAILVGQATRISSLVMDLPKEYRLMAQFGAHSSTYDPTGEITPTGRRVRRSEVATALLGFVGTGMQRVPLTSAVKVAGEPLYKRAHRGELVDTPERPVTFHEITLVDFDEDTQIAEILVRSGKGAYVRSLAHDVGERVGAGAYAAGLRRLRVGPFDVRDALSPEDLRPETYLGTEKGVFSLGDALVFVPRHEVGARDAERARHGNLLHNTPSGCFSVFFEGCVLGVYEGAEGIAAPKVVFANPEG